MDRYYSASTGGFYPDDEALLELCGGLPDDGKKITDQEWRDLLAGQLHGKQITPDENGYPELTDPEIIDPEIIAEEQAEAKMQDVAFSSLMTVMEESTGDTELRQKVKDKMKEDIKRNMKDGV